MSAYVDYQKLVFKKTNNIFFRTKNKSKESGETNSYLVNALSLEIAQYGYVLSKEISILLSMESAERIESISKFLILQLEERYQSEVNHTPLFLNFPDDVPDDNEYFFKRIASILLDFTGLSLDTMEDSTLRLSCGCLIDDSIFNIHLFGACPVCQKQVDEISEYKNNDRKPEFIYSLLNTSNKKLKKISYFPNEKKYIDFGVDYFQDLIQSRAPLSEEQKEDLRIVLKVYQDKCLHSGGEGLVIGFKENMSFFVKSLYDEKLITSLTDMKGYVKTATDLLRVITSLSDGDVSLSSNTRFIKFKRSERRELLSLLEDLFKSKKGNKISEHQILEDMNKYKKKWLRIGEILHPFEYKKRFPLSAEAFKKLRDDEKIAGFNSKIEKYIKTKDYMSAISILSSRPTELLRRYNELVKCITLQQSKRNGSLTSTDYMKLVEYLNTTLLKVIGDIPTMTLMKVYKHFLGYSFYQSEIFKVLHKKKGVPDLSNKVRAFFPKGDLAKIAVQPYTMMTEIEYRDFFKEALRFITIELEERFKNKCGDKYSSIIYSPELHNYVLPTDMRSISSQSADRKVIGRGSFIPIKSEENIIRLFTHWQGEGVDVDLSVSFWKDDFNLTEIASCSYSNLACSDYAIHSGDVQSALFGASEFIDIDIEKALSEGIRYTCVNVLVYSGDTFDKLNESFSGFMTYNNNNPPLNNYAPKDVDSKFDLNYSSKAVTPYIFDLRERKLLWMDMPTRGKRVCMTIEDNLDFNRMAFRAFKDSSLSKITFGDILSFIMSANPEAKFVALEDTNNKSEKKENKLIFGLDKGDYNLYNTERVISDFLS